MDKFYLIVFAFFGLVSSSLGVSYAIKWAKTRTILDIPNDRSSHVHPVPRGGGLVIVILVLVGALFYALGLQPELFNFKLLSYLTGAMLIAAISWLDDLGSVSAWKRFCIHAVSAIILIYGWGYFQEVNIPFLGTVSLGWAGAVITFLWVVGLTNIFNFMDGIDGIAGSQASVAGAGWAVIGWLQGELFISVLGLLILTSSLGFLRYNWSPAKIFMGDVGSAFLGFTFAALPLMLNRTRNENLVLGVFLMAPFVMDGLFTIFRRLLKRENIFNPHRSHLYQRLVIGGWSHRSVSILYAVFALLSVVVAVLVYNQNINTEMGSLLLLLPFGFILLTTIRMEQRLIIRTDQAA